MNQSPLTPAPQQDNNRAPQAHRPDVVFGHRGPLYNPNLSRPHVGAIGNAVGKGLNWAFPHSPTQHFGRNIGQTAHEAVQMFDPRTRAGLVNVLSAFAGGPKDTFGRDEFLMKAGHQPYSALKANEGGQLSRFDLPNVTNTRGPYANARSAEYQGGVRSIIKRAQGVGGYKQANPMDVIEAQRAALSKRLQELDKNKEAVNAMGRGSLLARQRTIGAQKIGDQMGGAFAPFGSRINPDFPTGSPEGVPRSFSNGLAAYNDGNSALLQMLQEMLFGGYPYKAP